MRYSFDIIVPRNTLATNPHVERVRLDTGTLTQVIIKFRAGCHNRVSVAIFDSLEQIVPAMGGDSIVGDNDILSIPMAHELKSTPYELTVKGWSDTTRYEHKISFWFDLVETAKIEKGGLLSSIQHLLGGDL